MRFPAVLLASAATLLTIPSVAQTKFCIGGDLDHLSTAERSACSATARAVRDVADSMHAPGSWHFVVVCGEEGWNSYRAFSARDTALENASVDTDLDQQTTYFREGRLRGSQVQAFRRVVAHEVASALLHTDREDAIQVQMASWEHTGTLSQAGL